MIRGAEGVMRIALALLVVLVCASGGKGQDDADPVGTENQLLTTCTIPDRFDEALCVAYIAGVKDGFMYGEALMPHLRLVIPIGVTRRQLKDVVVKYLQDHPESRHLPAWNLTVIALEKSFPGK